jgi:hypothetical protein
LISDSISKKFLSTAVLPWWYFLMLFLSISEDTVQPPFKWGIQVMACLGLLISDEETEQLSLGAILICLLGCMWNGAFMAANHYYLIIYYAAYLFFRSMHWVDAKPYGTYLMIFVMGMAGIQKALAPYFMEGHLISELILDGGFKGANQFLFPNWMGIVDAFKPFAQNMKLLGPGEWRTFGQALPAYFESYCLGISYAIIGLELALALAMWRLAPKIWGWGLVAFVWGTFFFTREHMFFSLLCFFALADLSPGSKPLSWALKASIVGFILLKVFVY